MKEEPCMKFISTNEKVLRKQYPYFNKIDQFLTKARWELEEHYKIMKISEKPYYFLTTSHWATVMNQLKGYEVYHKNMSEFKTQQMINQIEMFSVYASFRYTQGVYSFSPEVYESLMQTPFSGEIPYSVFEKMPQWCLYIKTPDLTVENRGQFLEVDGFYVQNLAFTHRDGLPENDNGFYINDCLYVMFILKGVDFDADVEHCMSFSVTPNAQGHFIPKEQTAPLKKVLPLILYICSKEPEFDTPFSSVKFPKTPKLDRSNKLFQLAPALRPKYWNVGEKTGNIIKEMKETYSKIPHSIRPHIRKAHWHGYWTGSRKEGNQTFIHKWLPPTIVSGSEPA